MPSRPNASTNRFQSSSRRPAGGRHGDDVHVLGREVVTPAVQDVRDLLHPPEPRRDPALATRVADLVEELAEGERGAVLDVLLPLGGDLAHQVAHRQHEVDLGAVAVAEASRARPTCAREAVARISWLMIASPRARRTDVGEPVPRADRLGLEPAPRHPHQVEGRQEVRVVPAGGIDDAVARSRCRLWKSTCWRYDVPVLGVPTWSMDPLGHVSSSPAARPGPSRSAAEQHLHGQGEHPLLVRRRDARARSARLGQSAVHSVVTGGEPSSEVGGLVREPRVGTRRDPELRARGTPRAPGGGGGASARCGVRA